MIQTEPNGGTILSDSDESTPEVAVGIDIISKTQIAREKIDGVTQTPSLDIDIIHVDDDRDDHSNHSNVFCVGFAKDGVKNTRT